jgi:membrane-associated protease RseP (regulator of RpoE activity)
MDGLLQAVQSAEVVVIVHVAALAWIGWAVGARLEEISVGFGPALQRFSVRGVSVVWRLLTLGGYVKFFAEGESPERESSTIPPVGTWESLSALRRIAVQLSGCFALLAAAAVVLGAATVAAQLPRMFGLIVFGSMSFTDIAAHAVRRWLAFVESRGQAQGTALLAVAAAAFNLLPLPTLNGGRVLWEVLGRGKPLPPVLALAAAILVLALLGSWGIGLLWAVR